MGNESRVWESTVYSAAKNLVEKLAGIEKIFAPTYSAGAAGLRPGVLDRGASRGNSSDSLKEMNTRERLTKTTL
jgi:hypothetical protein